MKKHGLILSSLAAAPLVLALLWPLTATAQFKTRFNWTSPASNLSGSWVDYEEGFFNKHGLDVELLHIDAEILELTYNEARAHIEWPPYLSRKGVETIVAELAPTEPKAKGAKAEDFFDHRYVDQLAKEGLFKSAK